MSEYTIEDRVATEAEHTALREAIGWEDHIDDDVLGRSLRGSLHGVVAVRGDEVVAMARVVGDGAHYFYIQDVVVHPDHEEHGLGSQLTQRLLDWIAARADGEVFVGLFASPEAESMYESLGFVTADMTGMHRSIG